MLNTVHRKILENSETKTGWSTIQRVIGLCMLEDNVHIVSTITTKLYSKSYTVKCFLRTSRHSQVLSKRQCSSNRSVDVICRSLPSVVSLSSFSFSNSSFCPFLFPCPLSVLSFFFSFMPSLCTVYLLACFFLQTFMSFICLIIPPLIKFTR